MEQSIHLKNFDTRQMALSYSPVWEVFLSLYNFSHAPSHPLNIAWMEQINPTLRIEIQAFGILYNHQTMPFFSGIWPLTSTTKSFEDEMRVLQEMSPEVYAQYIVSSILSLHEKDKFLLAPSRVLDKNVATHVITIARETYAASVPMLQELFSRPERSHQRFVTLLLTYWRVYIKPRWSFLEKQLLEDIKQRRQVLFMNGAEAMLHSLFPELHLCVQADKAILYYPTWKPLEISLSHRLILIPSHFVRFSWLITQGDMVAIVYVMRKHEEEMKMFFPSDTLLRRLKGVADLTRLQILQLLSKKSLSTSELARLVGISEAGISKHLKYLQKANLVVSERSGYYVIYRLMPNVIAEIQKGLEELLQDGLF